MAVTLAAGAALLAPVSPAAAGPVTGPGTYYLVRSQATGRTPAPQDDASCDTYLGFPHNLLTVQRLDAVLNAPVVDPASGEITNGVAAPVAPAYLCAAVGADGGLADSYARATFAATGVVEAAGPCDLALSAAQLGSALAQCRLATRPGSPSGLITTNSVLNPLGGTGAQTGSLITAYFPGITPAADGAPPAAAPAPVPGARFSVLRDGGSSTVASAAGCPKGWRARVTTLRAAQVTRTTGQVAPASGPAVGDLTVCYAQQATAAAVTTRAVLRLGSATIRAEGQCRNRSLAGLSGMLTQTCGLWLKAPLFTIQDGLLTGTLLVPPGDSAGTADSGVWTFATLTSS